VALDPKQTDNKARAGKLAVAQHWGRWQSYVQTGHGGNEGLKIREASDYRVSILETAGNQLSRDDIIALEQLWKAKLQSKEMGLNKN